MVMATLYVYMNGNEVGEYVKSRSGAQEFIYADSWMENENAIPISLSLPLTEQIHRGDVVINYFDNLLPDNRDIRERIQARVGAKTNQPFDLLAEIGRDCVGAIQLLSEKSKINVKRIAGKPLNEAEIADELRNYKSRPLGMRRDEEFRISIAGAQEKTALLLHEGKWQKPTGATPTTHIFKLPIGKIEHSGVDLSESVENEWLCLKILKAFGLNVAEAEIKTFEDQKTLVVRRFDRELSSDRTWLIRKPIEDMCQIHGISPARKYEADGGPGIHTIMELLLSSLEPEDDRRHFMKSIFIFWLLGAIDGHAKNFSIFLRAGGRFQLTPLYDVLSAHPMVAKRQLEYKDLTMAMALHGSNTHYKIHEIMPRHWYNEAKRASYPKIEMEAVIDSVIMQLDGIVSKVASELPKGFPEHIATPIFEGMRNHAERFNPA
jgi:serine/threonine-protein kinase HipA